MIAANKIKTIIDTILYCLLIKIISMLDIRVDLARYLKKKTLMTMVPHKTI